MNWFLLIKVKIYLIDFKLYNNWYFR